MAGEAVPDDVVVQVLCGHAAEAVLHHGLEVRMIGADALDARSAPYVPPRLHGDVPDLQHGGKVSVCLVDSVQRGACSPMCPSRTRLTASRLAALKQPTLPTDSPSRVTAVGTHTCSGSGHACARRRPACAPRAAWRTRPRCGFPCRRGGGRSRRPRRCRPSSRNPSWTAVSRGSCAAAEAMWSCRCRMSPPRPARSCAPPCSG